METNLKKVLVIDDEPLMGESLREALLKWNFDVTLSQESSEAMRRLTRSPFDVVLTDIRMPDVSGMDILQKVKQVSPATGVILMTAYGTIEQAVDAMKVGAFDYLTKPFDLDEIRECLLNFFHVQELSPGNKNTGCSAPAQFIGQSKSLDEFFESQNLAYQCDAPVFIQSESGTGKELVASLIHHNSARKKKPYLRINCAALPENLVESQLFGHERGAFTGAIRTFKGLFGEAREGTVLLDEITEMPTHLQAKLLRVLQEGEFTRVGSNQPIRTNARIIATSNCDVQSAVESGKFRQDLLFRLNVITIRIPPLRARKDDIPLLVDHFIRTYSQKYSRPVSGMGKRALDALFDYHWPGNVRELENVIHRCVLACPTEDRIRLHHVRKHWLPEKREETDEPDIHKDLSLEEMEKHLIRSTLERHNHHKTRTAAILGITLKTLRKKMLLYGLEP